MENEKKLSKAEILAKYVVQNICYCPIDDEVSVPDCPGWCVDGKKCVKCILRHTDALYLM